MIVVVIYADILITLNLVVNYFLILATKHLLRVRVKWFRTVIGAFLGAIASLYIFFPQTSLFTEITFKITLCAVISLTVFGFKSVKQYTKSVIFLFLVTCAYAGLMIAIWYLFKPSGMAINNSIVYFNFSPTVMVVISVLVYLVFVVCNKIFTREANTAEECEISVWVGEKNIEYKAIVDTGNSLYDIFGKSEILIVDEDIIRKLFDKNIEIYSSRYRVIPFKSVSGDDMLHGYRCDRSVVKSKDLEVTLDKPILASSKIPLKDGFSGIVNPKIFD